MKTRLFLIILIVALFFSGCVVYSFYPLYTEKDLFANDILIGNWMDEDGSEWDFEHPHKGKKELGIIDSLSYVLNLSDKANEKAKFNVHVLKFGDHYFLDFYLEEFQNVANVELASFHIIPVHTFAKLTVEKNQLQINWFDQEWLEELIKENKIRIHHEKNDEFILLTAKPRELQKFVAKYANSVEAFKNGLEVILTRK